MKFLARIALGLLVGIFLMLGSFHVGTQLVHADSPPMLLDAGLGSGSAIAVPTAAAPTPIDPTADPAGFLKQLSDLYHSGGWVLLILFGVFGLCELLAVAGKNLTALAWLGKGRVSIVLGGLAAVTTAAIAALTHAGTWGAVAAAVIGAYSLWAHPAATDVAIAKVAKAAELPVARVVT